MKKYYFITALFLVTIILSGCGINKGEENKKAYPYRDISQDEINHFIPAGYDILKDESNNNYGIIKVSFLKETDKQVALILLPKGIDIYNYNEEMSPRIVVLGFNRSTDTWGMLWDVYDFWAAGISEYEITDSDKDGIEEINVLLNLGCGSSCTYHQAVFTVRNNAIIDLMPISVTSNLSFVKLDDGRYLKVYYMWDKGESHFGCHYFAIDEYELKEFGYKFIKTINFGNKYALDEFEAKGLCEPYNEYRLIKMIGY